MEIIEYSKEYLESFIELMNDWGPSYNFSREDLVRQIDDALSCPENTLLIAVEGGVVLSYMQLRICSDIGFRRYAEIIQFLVREPERSRGIGRMMLEKTETFSRDMGVNCIKLHSRIERSRAHVFYEKNGFRFYKCSKFYEKDV